MMMKVSKVLWIGVALFVLFVTLSGYYSAHDHGIWNALVLLMLILSFPAGLVASLVLLVIEDWVSITSKTSYFSLIAGWAAYFVLGYFQWFVLLPWLWRKWRAKRARGAASSV